MECGGIDGRRTLQYCDGSARPLPGGVGTVVLRCKRNCYRTGQNRYLPGDARARSIPEGYLRRFCRKGVGPEQGNIRVVAELRDRVDFFTLNLHETFADIGQFDLIFLRNVLIYFENETKQKVLERIAGKLKPDGVLFVGHSESLHGITERFLPVKPAIYRRAK